MSSFTSTIREDLLVGEHTEPEARVIVEHVYNLFIDSARDSRISPPLKSLGPAKELDECFALIKKAIDAKEEIDRVIPEARLKKFTWEEPTTEAELEAISILPQVRLPAALSAGKADKNPSRVREVVAHIREEGWDDEDHNYRTAVLGKMYDNFVLFTCWGRTNKGAFARSVWFEDLIEEYAWYFTSTGINRIIVQGTKDRITKKIGDNIIYGYPVEVFIRTEKIKVVSEKALEQIIMKVGLANS